MKYIIAATLVVGLLAGFLLANNVSNKVSAASVNTVDRGTLEQLYNAAFGRSLDSEAGFHIGRDLGTVLRDINDSSERRYYVALFKAVKAYEEAIRAPGDLSAEDKVRYLAVIDSALATLLTWVETLPERPICDGVIRPTDAREAIVTAYQGIASAARANAEQGVFDPSKHIGHPNTLALPNFRCNDIATTPPILSCSTIAKLCSDGSSVSRTGPNCEFAACPSPGY